MDGVVVTSLVNIHSTNARDKERALRILINRTLNEKVRREVLSEMGTSTFVALLQSDSDVILMLSAWLLSHIAIDDKNCGILLQTGVLTHMVPLLTSDNADVLEKTLWVVNNLLTSAVREHIIGKFSIISSLTNLLSTASPHIISTSADILKNLMHKDSCQDYDENQKIFCEQQGLHVLARQLEPQFPPIPHKTLLAVISLSHVFTLYESSYRLKFAEEGVITSLVSLIATPSTIPDIREHALRVLYNISLEEQALKYLVENSALSALVSFILSTDEIKSNPNVLGLSILILANGVVDEDMRTSLRQIRDFGAALYKLGNGLVDKPQAAQSSDNGDSQAFMEVIANASCDEIVRYQLQHSKEIQTVVEKVVAVARDTQLRQLASTALENLSIPVEPAVVELQQQGMSRDESVKAIVEMKGSLGSSSKIFRNLDSYTRDPMLQRIISELFITEQSYVYNLGVCVRVFLTRVVESALLPTAHLLRSMGNRFRESAELTCIGDIIVTFWDHTRAIEEYRAFVTHFDQAQTFMLQLTNKMSPLKKLFNELMYHRETQGLSLFSYMIQPIQRIPRYILMLEDLVRQLPKNDPDYANLSAALVKTKKSADMLNEAKREAEKVEKMREIQEKLVDVPKGFVLLGIKECLKDGLLVEDRLFGSRHIHVLMCTFPRKRQLKIEYIIKLRDLAAVLVSQEKGTQQTMMHLKWKEKDSEKDLNLYLDAIEATEWHEAIQKAKQGLQLPKAK